MDIKERDIGEQPSDEREEARLNEAPELRDVKEGENVGDKSSGNDDKEIEDFEAEENEEDAELDEFDEVLGQASEMKNDPWGRRRGSASRRRWLLGRRRAPPGTCVNRRRRCKFDIVPYDVCDAIVSCNLLYHYFFCLFLRLRYNQWHLHSQTSRCCPTTVEYT